MDKLREVAKKMEQMKRNTDEALRREYQKRAMVHRVQDVFDYVIPFEMEFESKYLNAPVDISLYFKPPPPSPCVGTGTGTIGCYAGNCEYFTGTTDNQLTVLYEYISNTVSIFYNGVPSELYTESGVKEVTILSTPATTDIIKVCYVYHIEGCN